MPGIKMIPVISSNVGAIGYDAGTRTLRVYYLMGSTYDYSDVPPEKWEELQEATSTGSFVEREIKGKYEYKKVGDMAEGELNERVD